MKRVLVLDANQRSALATTRALGQRGVSVISADDSITALAGCSRYSENYITYPSPQTRAEEFIEKISEIITGKNVDIVLPMTELTTALLLKYRERLPTVTLPFPDLATIDALADKCALMRLAQSLSIPVPQTWFVHNPQAIPDNLKAMPYPLVLKPGKSWLPTASHWMHTQVRFAQSPGDVQTFINTDPAFHQHPFMLQECIQGTGQGVFALYDHGKALAFFSHRRIREKPPWGGVSVLSESTRVDPTLQKYARALLDSVDWHGIAMVEFKVAADGTPYLMEINTRFWGSLQLAIDAGVDFPWMLYQLACDEPVTPVTRYKIGRRLRWVLGDLDATYILLKDKRYSLASKLATIGRFLRPAPIKTRHEVNRWHDLRPFWWELGNYLRNLRG